MSPSITRADVARLGRRTQHPTLGPGELLAVWVNGTLVNTKNARLHWKSEATYKRTWRERVSQVLLEVLGRHHRINPAAPKRVLFIGYPQRPMDDDGLAVAIAPIRDELITCRVISGDAKADGHLFTYELGEDRRRRGVEIHITLRGESQ